MALIHFILCTLTMSFCPSISGSLSKSYGKKETALPLCDACLPSLACLILFVGGWNAAFVWHMNVEGSFQGCPNASMAGGGAYCSQRASLTVLMVALRASTSPSTHHISHSTVISNRQSVIFQAHNAGSDIKPFRLSNKVKNYILYFRESLL